MLSSRGTAPARHGRRRCADRLDPGDAPVSSVAAVGTRLSSPNCGRRPTPFGRTIRFHQTVGRLNATTDHHARPVFTQPLAKCPAYSARLDMRTAEMHHLQRTIHHGGFGRFVKQKGVPRSQKSRKMFRSIEHAIHVGQPIQAVVAVRISPLQGVRGFTPFRFCSCRVALSPARFAQPKGCAKQPCHHEGPALTSPNGAAHIVVSAAHRFRALGFAVRME